MNSVVSYVSRASQNAQTIISNIASRNGELNTKGLTSLLDEETVSQVWQAFGLYLSRQLRMGRGVLIKDFGIFSFSAPEVVLDGVTNPTQRDKQSRQPVFLVAKEYVKGKNLKPALATHGSRQIRPYQCQTSGNIQQTKINYAEIAGYAQQNKDAAKIGVERVLKAIANMARNRENVEIDIPGVGTLLIRNDMAAVAFHESLSSQCKGITKRPLSERKLKGDMTLNQNYLQRLTLVGQQNQDQGNTIDDQTKNYLSNTLGINVDKLGTPQDTRPKTAKFPQSQLFQKSAFPTSKIKMCQDDFLRSIKKIDLPLKDVQINSLFEQIDPVDKPDWLKVLPVKKTHINYIKDVVFKYQLHTDDVLQRMNLNRDHCPLDFNTLRDALQLLDESLNLIKAQKLAKDILGEKDQITILELVSLFDTVEEDDKFYDISWFKNTLHRLRNHLMSNNNNKQINQQRKRIDKLQEAFEFFDEHQEGNLDTANFKNVIMENNVGLSVQDINRLVRYIPKIRGTLINYYNFLKMIQDVNKRADQHDIANDLADFAIKTAKFIKQNKLTIPYFLQIVRASSQIVVPEQMANYLMNNIFSSLPYDSCLQFSKQMDLDHDGTISEEDIQNFLNRYSYFELKKGMKEMGTIISSVINSQNTGDVLTQFEQTILNSKSIDLISSGQTKMFETLVNGMKDQQIKTLHPIQPLSEDKFNRILKNLRIKLQSKGLSYQDFFALLDNNHNGFINISEFSDNVENIMKLSKPAKDGFFAFMDRQRIGLVDLNTFIRYVGKSVVHQMPELSEDNWDWELEMMNKIRSWCKRENLTLEDAFRTFDRDFDGEISKGDIRFFIKDIFKIEDKEITETKLNRLFKLMDQFKRGKITLMDFRRFIDEGLFYGQNKQIFGDPFSKGIETQSAKVQVEIRSSFDWKANARQQIGLVISRHFPSVKQSYDIISGYRKKLVFQMFKKWIDDLNVVAGFDLTEKLLYELFSDLDLHNKGFLTEIDWTNAFAHFHWIDQMIREITEACKNFESSQHAVNFFKNPNQNVITRDSFFSSINSLFPKRFQDSDIQSFWNKIQKNGQLTVQTFQLMFGDRSSTYAQANQINAIPPEIKQQDNISLVDRIRRYLRNSNKNLQEIFGEYDPDTTGKITNIEFRQIIRGLNMGLTLQEIDQLCSICTTDSKNMFDWKEFAKMLSFRQADYKILDRASIHLSKINDHIYNYLITPKDAFRQFDVNRSGHLSFQQFKDFIETVYRLACEEQPPFAIIKDLFEFLDKRRDGHIDLTEWMDAFSNFANPNMIKKRPSTVNVKKHQSGQKGKNLSASEKKQHIPVSTTNNFKDFQGITDDGLLNAGVKFKSFLRKSKQKQNTLYYQDNGIWESSKEFDKIITTIGKNRKYLQDIFRQLSSNGTITLTEETIINEMDIMLRSQGIFINEEQWPSLIAWSKKNNRIDYKFLLSVYKDRLGGIDSQPRIVPKLEN